MRSIAGFRPAWPAPRSLSVVTFCQGRTKSDRGERYTPARRVRFKAYRRRAVAFPG